MRYARISLILSHALLKRTGKVEEVAKLVTFMLLEASYMTGTTIEMEGGYLLGGENSPEYPEGIL